MVSKRQNFSLKNDAFGTLDFTIENALEELKINQKMLLKDSCTNILNDFYLIIECQVKKYFKMS